MAWKLDKDLSRHDVKKAKQHQTALADLKIRRRQRVYM